MVYEEVLIFLRDLYFGGSGITTLELNFELLALDRSSEVGKTLRYELVQI